MSFFFTAPRDVARLFRGALATVQRRIEHRNGRTASESEALDAILEHSFETWQLANAELQREHRVFERDGWRCTFPGTCSCREPKTGSEVRRGWPGPRAIPALHPRPGYRSRRVRTKEVLKDSFSGG
jgi:hypothetical protein